MSRDRQKDMELAHTARYEYKIEHLNPVLDALFYWLQEAEKWRIEAFKKYPTPDAYDAACAALYKHRERADKAEAREQKLREAIQTAIEMKELNPEQVATDQKGLYDAAMWFLSGIIDSLYPKEGEA